MKLLKEPFVHFVLAGAVLFGAYGLVDRGGPAQPNVEPVRIGDGELRWLRETFAAQWQREPTPDEMKALVDNLLEEELLAREAESLGLLQGDTVIRRRLADKLSFMIEGTARVLEPSEDELRAFHARHAERFRAAGRVSFEQVYFDPQRRSRAVADAAAALARLSAGADAKGMGDRLLIDTDFHDLDEAALSSLFGPEFARAVLALEPGSWQGPLESGYGLHLVFVSAASPSAVRTFEDARADVLREWRLERERETKAAYLAELRKKYGVEAGE